MSYTQFSLLPYICPYILENYIRNDFVRRRGNHIRMQMRCLVWEWKFDNSRWIMNNLKRWTSVYFRNATLKCEIPTGRSEGIVKIEAGAEVMWKGEANVHISRGFKLDHIINSSLPAALVAAFCMHRVANILPGYLLQVLAPGTDIPPLIPWRTAPLSDIGKPFAVSTFDIMIIDPPLIYLWFI